MANGLTACGLSGRPPSSRACRDGMRMQETHLLTGALLAFWPTISELVKKEGGMKISRELPR